MNLLQIPEGFQNQKIDTTFDQRTNLLAESVARFLIRSLAQRFDSGSQWANRTRNAYIEAFGGFPGEPDSGAIDVEYLINQAVPCKPECIGAERVGFNDFSSSLQVVVMNAADQVRLREVQFVIRAVDENSFLVQQCAHGAVTQHWGLFYAGKKIARHVVENTGCTRFRASIATKLCGN